MTTLVVNDSTVLSVAAEGLSMTLARKRPVRICERALHGRQVAHLVALPCGVPPDGRARWSLRLLAGELVRLEVVETVSHETLRQTLKKRPEALAPGALVPDADRRPRLRLADGG